MKRLTVHEFLCFVRRECEKGCENCVFRYKFADVENSKRYCVFHYFDCLSDYNISSIMNKVHGIEKMR